LGRKKIQQYKEGREVTWLEKRDLEHGNPLHCVLAIIGAILLIYGLWIHGWAWIIAGVALNFLGHLYCWLKK